MAQPTENRASTLIEDEDDALGGFSDFFGRNSKAINVLLTAALIIAAGVGIYRWQTNSKNSKASALYGNVIENVQKALPETDAAKRKESLQAAILSAENLARDYPGMYAGRQGQLMAGNAYYLLAISQSGAAEGVESLTKAKEAFQKYLGMNLTNEETAAGYLALGDVLQNQTFIKNDSSMQKEVIATYEKAFAAAKGTHLEPEVKLTMATFMIGVEGASQERAETLLKEVEKENSVKPTELSKDIEKALATESDSKATTEQLAEIKSLQKLSYSDRATQLLNRTRALGTTAK